MAAVAGEHPQQSQHLAAVEREPTGVDDRSPPAKDKPQEALHEGGRRNGQGNGVSHIPLDLDRAIAWNCPREPHLWCFKTPSAQGGPNIHAPQALKQHNRTSSNGYEGQGKIRS